MATECFSCGDTGHVYADCPQRGYPQAGDAQPWCGHCGKRTRLIGGGDTLTRCPACHPLRDKPLPGHRRCPSCRRVVYVWDHRPCGEHQPLATGAQR